MDASPTVTQTVVGLPRYPLRTYLFVNGELPRLYVCVVFAIFTRHRKHRSKLLRSPPLLRPELRKLLLLSSRWHCGRWKQKVLLDKPTILIGQWSLQVDLQLLGLTQTGSVSSTPPPTQYNSVTTKAFTYRVRGRITNHHHRRTLLVVHQGPELAQSFVQRPLRYDVLTWLRVALFVGQVEKGVEP